MSDPSSGLRLLHQPAVMPTGNILDVHIHYQPYWLCLYIDQVTSQGHRNTFWIGALSDSTYPLIYPLA